MEKSKSIFKAGISCLLFSSLIILLLYGPTLGDYLKTNNPPDVDKADHLHGNKPSCWVTSAAGMLAGAGYGDGNNPQERADDIYDEMCSDANIDCNKCGWTDTAVSIWLRSANNTWKNTNPYKYISILGPANCKIARNPWTKTDLPMFMANELRKCYPIGLSTLQADKTFGHAITLWGDEGTTDPFTDNPTKLKVSDSDYWDISQAIQTYTYDDYNNPNPGGGNQGVGWYFNYNNNNHRYIDHCYALSDISYDPNIIVLGAMKKYVGSYKIHQDVNDANALWLHYTFKSDGIFSYRTTIDWDNNDVPPSIIETNNPPTKLKVTWDLRQNPVPHCNDVTITTEVMLDWKWGTLYLQPRIWYEDVNFSYFDFKVDKPGFGWTMGNSLRGVPVEPNATGGYIIGAFDIYDSPTNPIPIAQYRLISQYGYDEDPEYHEFIFEAPPQSYFVGNFRFGHSYALLDDQALWGFSEWWQYQTSRQLINLVSPIQINFAGRGLLPYPKGQDLTNPEPEECGDPGTWYVGADINRDCVVDFKDFADFAAVWLECTDPNQNNCP